jgi:hypothetical protein
MKHSNSLCATIVAFNLVVAACSSSTSAPGSGGVQGKGGTTGSGGGTSVAGTGGASGGATGSGGAGTGGQTGAGGAAGSGRDGGRPDAPIASGGSADAGVTGVGGRVEDGGKQATGGAGGSTQVGTGGTTGIDGGGKLDSSGGTIDTGSVTAGSCSRELLKTTVDAYFKALAAHDPSTLPLADNVKFTENAKSSKIGQAGLWKTAGALKYIHTAYDERTEGCDTVCCTAVSQAVVPESSTDLTVALRLKMVDQKITEVETIAARKGDYMMGPDGKALADSAKIVKWEDAPPAGKANTRAEITKWINKYFSMFPKGFCNMASNCKRMENGSGNFQCDEGGSCSAGDPSGKPAMEPRALMADEQTGLGVGWTMFSGQYTDMHMIKMYGGEIYAVSAILVTASDSGW